MAQPLPLRLALLRPVQSRVWPHVNPSALLCTSAEEIIGMPSKPRNGSSVRAAPCWPLAGSACATEWHDSGGSGTTLFGGAENSPPPPEEPGGCDRELKTLLP